MATGVGTIRRDPEVRRGDIHDQATHVADLHVEIRVVSLSAQAEAEKKIFEDRRALGIENVCMSDNRHRISEARRRAKPYAVRCLACEEALEAERLAQKKRR